MLEFNRLGIPIFQVVGHTMDLHRQAAAANAASGADAVKKAQAVLSANVSKEILKLGVSKTERAAVKDYVKALCSMSPESWLTPSMVNIVVLLKIVILHTI